MKHTFTIIICIIITEALGFTVGMLTREGTRLYAGTMIKPPFSPPAMLFPVAWTILYALMGVGVAIVINSAASAVRTSAVLLFVLQIIFNLSWCFIFFSFRNYRLALVWIVVLLILSALMMLHFKKISPVAGYMQIPYIVWLVFATYLNAGVMVLNR